MQMNAQNEPRKEGLAFEFTISERGVSLKAWGWQIALSAIISLTLLGQLQMVRKVIAGRIIAAARAQSAT